MGTPGIAQPLSSLKSIEFNLLNIREQDRIEEILTSLDNKITLNSQTNQTLEQIAQAIFKSWFVDFDPVKAKMRVLEAGGSAKQAEFAAMSVLSSKDETALKQLQNEDPQSYAELEETAVLFPSAMQKSELGEIPVGWEVTELRTLSLKISKGTTPRKASLEKVVDKRKTPFLKVRNITDSGEILRDALDRIPESISISVLKRSVLSTNDILVSIAGTIGRVAIVEGDLNESNCNQAVAFVRLYKPDILLELIRLALKSQRVQNDILSKVVQGVQANFSLTGLGEVKIVLSPERVLSAFNCVVIPTIHKQRSLSSENRKLSEIRDTLLPKLLSGEIDLSQNQEDNNELGV